MSMGKDICAPWGAYIERGVVTASAEGLTARCDVRSIDRPGCLFYALPSPEAYAPGTAVFFFAFNDGRGRIIGQIE